jgi:Sap, sulfolipid-1-addressing protein
MELQILPLAITMMAGPQIMTAIVLVTHPAPIRVSIAFLIGVTVAMLVETSVFYALGSAIDLGDPSDKGSTGTIIQLVLVGLLVLLAIFVYRHRENSEPPKWLGGLLTASPLKALLIGLVLILVMPTDIITMLTVGVNLQQNDASLFQAVPFWALTLFIAALPLLGYLLFRKRAQTVMPKVRDWMGTHSWLVNIIVIGIFIFLILG